MCTLPTYLPYLRAIPTGLYYLPAYLCRGDTVSPISIFPPLSLSCASSAISVMSLTSLPWLGLLCSISSVSKVYVRKDPATQQPVQIIITTAYPPLTFCAITGNRKAPITAPVLPIAAATPLNDALTSLRNRAAGRQKHVTFTPNCVCVCIWVCVWVCGCIYVCRWNMYVI